MHPNEIRTRIDEMYRPHIGHDTELLTVDDPTKLLTWNRFDLAVKLAYLSNRSNTAAVYPMLYKKHIRAFSLGTFAEPGKPEKDSFDRYVDEFELIHESIKRVGFSESTSLVPLASDGSIINGAHRVSSAILLGRTVSAVRLPIDPSIYDWQFFYQRGLSTRALDLAATEFIRHSKNTYVALLWPRSEQTHSEMARLLEHVVYDKTIHLSSRGAHNLICASYRGEPWLGAEDRDFPGAKGKLVEVFKENSHLRAIAFQSRDLDAVSKIKEELRARAGIGKHSVHVTDSPQESQELASLLFNENGVHFLNYANPNKFRSMAGKFDRVMEFLRHNRVPVRDAVVDSSAVLELYGIRQANDIDLLLSDHYALGRSDEDAYCHDSELEHHRQSKDELIYDPAFHFLHKGIKLISFAQVYEFKRARGEEKDVIDLAAMSALTNQRPLLAGYISTLRGEVYFRKAQFLANFRRIAAGFRLYHLLRDAKRRFLGPP